MRELRIQIDRHLPHDDAVIELSFLASDLSLPSAPQITWRSQSPGGFATMSFAIQSKDLFSLAYEPSSWLRSEPSIPPLARVRVLDGGDTLWEGYIARRDYDGPNIVAVNAVGYSGYLNKGVVKATGESLVSASDLLRTVVGTVSPVVRVRGFSGIGGTYRLSDFTGRSAAEVVSQIAGEGDNAGRLVDWGVWDDRYLTLTSRVQTQTPNYRTVHFAGRTFYEEDFDSARDSINIAYRDPEGVDRETGWTAARQAFLDRYGYSFQALVQGGVLTDEAAEHIRLTYQRTLFEPIVRARAEFTRDFPLRDNHGNAVDHARVRAGQTIQFGVLPSLSIVSADYNANEDSVSIEAGAERRSLDALLARMNRYAEGVANRTQPITGARLE